MATLFRDPLLSVTRKLLRFCYIVLFVVAGLMLIMGLFAAVFGLNTSPYAHQPPTSGAEFALLAVALAPVLVLYGWFLRLLREIVDTVAAGTPFLAANADRLTRMGWLALLLKGIVLAERGLLQGSLSAFGKLGARFDGPSLLMILTLFVLARVFRQGSAMREDLEGTV